MPSALITGGSRGLGRAIATELAARQWDVIVTGRNRSALEDTLDEISSRATGIAGDVTEIAHRDQVSGEVGWGLDLLINNASYLGPSPLQGVADIDPAEVRRILDVNVVAPLALIRQLLPRLSRRRGAIVNISSDAAVEAYAGWGPYGASKAALDHATAVLAVEQPELAVYSFDPGDMRTDMHQAAFPGEDISDRPEPESVVPAVLRLIAERPPSGRYRAVDYLVKVQR